MNFHTIYITYPPPVKHIILATPQLPFRHTCHYWATVIMDHHHQNAEMDTGDPHLTDNPVTQNHAAETSDITNIMIRQWNWNKLNFERRRSPLDAFDLTHRYDGVIFSDLFQQAIISIGTQIYFGRQSRSSQARAQNIELGNKTAAAATTPAATSARWAKPFPYL